MGAETKDVGPHNVTYASEESFRPATLRPGSEALLPDRNKQKTGRAVRLTGVFYFAMLLLLLIVRENRPCGWVSRFAQSPDAPRRQSRCHWRPSA